MADNANSNPNFEPVVIDTDELNDVPSDSKKSSAGDAFVPEEISEETPEDLTVENLGADTDADEDQVFTAPPSVDAPPVFEDDSSGGNGNIRKYVLLGLGVVGTIVVFIIIFNVIQGLLRGGSNEKVTLEYWGLWEDEAVMKRVIADYKKIKPNVTINYVNREYADYRVKLVTRAGEGGGPDIFRFHNTWLPSIVDIAAPMPNSVMSAETYKETFYPVIESDAKYNNSYYGIALGIDGLVLLYNNDLFKRAGINAPPKTWDDLNRHADSLRVLDPEGRIVTSGIALGSARNIEHFSDILGWMLLQNGADIRDLSKPEAIEMLVYYRQFAEPQINFWNSSMPNDVNAFIQGKVAMIIVPSWHVLNIKAANPQLEVKVAPLPVLPGEQPISLASYWMEGVSRSSKNQKAAWEFLAYLSSKETMTKLFEEQSKVRLFGVAYSRKDLRDELINHEYLGPVLVQAPYMKSMPVAARTYDQGLNDEIITYLRNAVNSTEEGVSYKEAFTRAAQGVSGVFDKYSPND